MSNGIWEREQAYRKRLYLVTPVAIMIVGLFFVTSDHVSFEDIERQIGWRGEIQLLPEITIISDIESENSIERERNLEAMTTLDLELLEGVDISNPEFQNINDDDERDVLDLLEREDFDIRTVKANQSPPYSKQYILIKMVEPIYPSVAMNAGIEGNVLVELLVNERGLVDQAKVLSSYGPQSFEKASLVAVKQFIFQPPTKDGKPTSMWIKFIVKFRLF